MDVLCKSLNKDENIPLADDDPQVIVQEKNETTPEKENKQNDLSASSTLPFTEENYDSLNSDVNADEMEEKARLIFQVLELQNTLDDLSQRVDTVKEENLKLRSENQVLGQYIENLMSASSVFQSTTAKSKK